LSLDDFLALLVYALVPFAWVSAGILFWAARRPPRIGALTERSWIALVIAIFLTSISVIVFNSESGQTLLAVEVARVIFRASVVLLGLVPVSWVVLWASGRLS
jgi:hypothetical protein